MSFRRRTYPEILDNLLTELAGGVAAEAHPFPPPLTDPYRHTLQRGKASQIISLYGARDGASRRFTADTDYRLQNDGRTLEWLASAALPDPGTLVYVNYFPEGADAEARDLHVGSVLRTVCESIGLEIARLDAQLDAVYQSGFVDSAAGSALDRVVALLGLTRVRGARAAGEVAFNRSPGSRGVITIPAGTRVMTADGEVEYATTDAATMEANQDTVRVAARDLEDNPGLAADSLTVLPVPIAGIGATTNPAPTAVTARDETDAELRTRAKQFLHGSERATLGAIEAAIARQQITADVEEVKGTPGVVKVTPHWADPTPEQEQRLWQAIADARPAGIVVDPQPAIPPRAVNLALRLTSAAGLTEQDLRAAQREVRAKVEDYFARLPAREAASINRLVGLVLAVPEIQDVALVSATVDQDATQVADPVTGRIEVAGYPTRLGDLSLVDPALPTQVNAVLSYPANAAPPDQSQAQAGLTAALAYLTSRSASTTSDAAQRQVSYARLLYATALPGHAAGSLAALDATTPAPTLPDETSVAPYRARFVLTQASGRSVILEHAADAPYLPQIEERLALAGVALSAETANA